MGKPKGKMRRGAASKSSSTQKPEPKYTINEILDKAEECLDEYKYELAQKFCERALQMDNDNVRALELSSGLLLDMGQVESAQHCLGRAIFLEPNSGHSKYLSLAQIMTGTESRDLYRKGVELMNARIASLPAGDESLVDLRRDLSNALVSVAEIYMSDLCDAEEAEIESKRCIEAGIEADETNPEAHQAYANYALVTGDLETAKSSMNKSLDLWLPDHIKFLEDGTGKETTLSYTFRTSSVKILLDLEDYDNAVKILDSLMEEDDQVVGTWYLLGWSNFLRCKSDTDYAGNARHYLTRAQEVHKKNPTDDLEMVEHINTLLQELETVATSATEKLEEPEAGNSIADVEADVVADILDREAAEASAHGGAQTTAGDNDVMMSEE